MFDVHRHHARLRIAWEESRNSEGRFSPTYVDSEEMTICLHTLETLKTLSKLQWLDRFSGKLTIIHAAPASTRRLAHDLNEADRRRLPHGWSWGLGVSSAPRVLEKIFLDINWNSKEHLGGWRNLSVQVTGVWFSCFWELNAELAPSTVPSFQQRERGGVHKWYPWLAIRHKQHAGFNAQTERI